MWQTYMGIDFWMIVLSHIAMISKQAKPICIEEEKGFLCKQIVIIGAYHVQSSKTWSLEIIFLYTFLYQLPLCQNEL